MEEVCFFNPAVLQADDFNYVSFDKRYGRAKKVTFDLINTWNKEIYDPEMAPEEFIQMSVIQDLEPYIFDPMPPEARHIMRVPPFDKRVDDHRHQALVKGKGHESAWTPRIGGQGVWADRSI